MSSWTQADIDAYHARRLAQVGHAKPTASKAATKPRQKAKPKFSAQPDAIVTTFVGVDPALRKGGFWAAIICRVENTITFKTCKDLGEYVHLLHDVNPIAVLVENSNLQKPMFDKRAGIGGAIAVGKNMGISQAATDIARHFSSIEPGISPKQKGAKVTNITTFDAILRANNLRPINYKGGETNAQDKRDAAMLALRAEQIYNILLRISALRGK